MIGQYGPGVDGSLEFARQPPSALHKLASIFLIRGAKRGSGAYWGPKKDAKKESNKVRRRNWKREVRETPTE